MTITIDIPEELLPKNGEERKFSIIHVHNGVATLLEDLDDVLHTITIQTDCFSTYAIVYADISAKTSDTGDTTPVIEYAIVSIALALLLLVIAQKRRRKSRKQIIKTKKSHLFFE